MSAGYRGRADGKIEASEVGTKKKGLELSSHAAQPSFYLPSEPPNCPPPRGVRFAGLIPTRFRPLSKPEKSKRVDSVALGKVADVLNEYRHGIGVEFSRTFGGERGGNEGRLDDAGQ